MVLVVVTVLVQSSANRIEKKNDKKKKRLPCFRTKLKLFKLNLKIFVKLILVVRTEEEGSEKKKNRKKKRTETAETADEKFSIIIIIIFFCVCFGTHTSRNRMLQPKVGLLLLLRKDQMAATIHLLLLCLFFCFFFCNCKFMSISFLCIYMSISLSKSN